MSTLRLNALLGVALAAIVALVFWPGLSGGFLFDDFPNIVTNPAIHAESLTWDSIRTALGAYEPGMYGRPLATITFAIDYYLGGKDAWQFKVTSVLVHLINTLIVFWLVKRLLTSYRPDSARSIAIASATVTLLWAAHPLQVSSVLYVVQRMETLSLTFVLLALVAYLHGRAKQRDGHRGWPWIVASGALAAVGLLSKETAALFPVYAFALELTVLGFEAKSSRTARTLRIAYAAGIVVTLALFLFAVLPRYAAPDAFSGRDFTLAERLLSQLRILPMYIGQMVLPLPSSLTFYYDAYPKSTGLLSPYTTLLGGMFIAALLVLAWRLRRRMALVSLGIFWFFASHLITSNVFPLELAFEHRNYFALLGILLALIEPVRRIRMADSPALKYVAIVAIAVGFGGLAMLRSAVWSDQLHLAMELVARNPDSPRASSDLGTIYAGMAGASGDSPFTAMAEAEFERGSRLPNASPLPEQALILVAASQGRPVKDEWWDRLIEKVRMRPIGVQEVMAVSGLLNQRYNGIELDDRRLSQALHVLFVRKEMSAYLYAQYGDYALTYLHDDALAEEMFVRAIDRAPTDAAYAARIFSTLTADGHSRQAKAVVGRARALGLMTDMPDARTPEHPPIAH